MARRKSPKQRKEERQQEKRRGQQTIIIGAVVVLAVFAAIVFALRSIPADVTIPEDIDRYENFLTSTTDEGYPLLGNPNAPITVREYSSFSCSACASFHDTSFSQLLPRIAAGEINFVYIPLTQTGAVPNGDGAARAALCAGEQGQFWEMHDVLFTAHNTYANAAFQNSRLQASVDALGLDSGQFTNCFNSNTTNATLAAAVQEGVGTTPTIEINGVQVDANITAINDSITSNLAGNTTILEPGVIVDESTENTGTTDETTTEPEATEAMDDMDEMESTEEAEAMDDMEATEEAEATEASE